MRLCGKLPTPRPIKGIRGESASEGDEESSTVKLLAVVTISDSTKAAERAAKATTVDDLGRFIYSLLLGAFGAWCWLYVLGRGGVISEKCLRVWNDRRPATRHPPWAGGRGGHLLTPHLSSSPVSILSSLPFRPLNISWLHCRYRRGTCRSL